MSESKFTQNVIQTIKGCKTYANRDTLVKQMYVKDSTLSLSEKLASRQFLKCSAPLTSRRFFHISSMDFRYVCLLSCHLHFSFFLSIISDYIPRHWHHCCIFRLVIPSSFSLMSNQLCHCVIFSLLCSSNSPVSPKIALAFKKS